MRHLRRKHSDIAEKMDNIKKRRTETQQKDEARQSSMLQYIQIDPKIVKIKTSREEIKNACMELVTTNGRPLSLLQDSGFRKIIDPICNALDPPLKITRKNIRHDIISRANSIRQNLKASLKDR